MLSPIFLSAQRSVNVVMNERQAHRTGQVILRLTGHVARTEMLPSACLCNGVSTCGCLLVLGVKLLAQLANRVQLAGDGRSIRRA